MRIAVYAGSFDPVTFGHLDIIRRAGEQYDRVVVCVAYNPKKTGLFDPEHRQILIWEALGVDVSPWFAPKDKPGDVVGLLEHLALSHDKYLVTTLPHEDLLVSFAHKIGAKALVRGLRAVSDFEAEFQMALVNRKLAPDVETVFFMTAHEHLFTSSSIVREVASLGGDLSAFVPPNVIKALKALKAR